MAVTPAVVLIHGEGLGAWIWTEVVTKLESPSVTPEFPQRRGESCTLSLEGYFQHLVQQIDASGLEHFVLVCHSASGIPGIMLAKHYGARVLGFAAVAAVIPQNGGSYLSCMPWKTRLLNNPESRLKALMLQHRLCLTKDGAARLQEQVGKGFTIVKESQAFYRDASMSAIPEIPSIYIKCEKDEVVPYNIQRQMRMNLNPSRVSKQPYGHLPMLDNSLSFSRLLQQFINRCY